MGTVVRGSEIWCFMNVPDLKSHIIGTRVAKLNIRLSQRRPGGSSLPPTELPTRGRKVKHSSEVSPELYSHEQVTYEYTLQAGTYTMEKQD